MSASTENVDEKKIVASVRAGANLVHSKPLFSHDSKFLFCCAETLVKVYSTVSGECVHDLKGHTHLTTGLVINSLNKLQLLSSSLDQTVIFWDYADCVLLKKIRLQGPLHGIWIRPGDQDQVQVLLQCGKSYDLVHCDLLTASKGESVTTVTDIPRISSDPRCSAIGCKGKFTAAVKGCMLYIKSTSKSSKIKKFSFPDLTCVACHPVDFCIATGTSTGKILLWWSFLGDQSHVVKTTLHWHALPVLDLTFTTEGSYLLSGGHECVLVKWQYNSEYRDFRPRLGAPLCHVAISPDNLLYATSHRDNVIHLLTSNLSVAQVFQGLTKTMSHKKKHCCPAGLNFDPRSKALVLNGKPGHLQFYSVHSDKQLYNLDIVCQNYISPENMKCPLDVTEVVQAEFNSTGSWLATVEYWNNRVMTPEMRLKFWQYNTETQRYTLNTTVEVPHDKIITCLRFRPDDFSSNNEDPMVVTTSLDGKFKIWSNMDDTNIYRANTKWSCESVGFYHDKPAGVCSFTADGSLLGVAFGTSVTLWDPDNNVLRETLSSQQGKIEFMEFGKKSCSHYLVTTTRFNITVWDLITCAVVWTARIKATHLISDPLSDVMAVFGENESLYVFKPCDPAYLYSRKNLGKGVEGGVFIPQQKKSSVDKGGQLSWQSESQLYWITSKQDLMTLTPKADEETPTKPIPLKTKLPQTPFSVLLTTERKRGFELSEYKDLDSKVYTTAAQFTAQLLETASHVQAPVTSLCNTFINSLLIQDKSHSTLQDGKDDDDDNTADVEEKPTNSDSDSDMDVDQKEESVSKNIQTPKQKVVRRKTDIVNKEKLCEIPNLDWYSASLKT
ncbi:WD repeat-containing protein 75-like [Pecten maximus]|uniref:WD repeat-containing protein 75-like n=1 Tax=Pecten maximus TaxID=6579 RepID=UPI00145880DD|nr:WD repeat-containing protein 75-like [Pecten maximus]